MRAAVVVPARNKEPHVYKCVKSVLAQNYSPLELIFSDQGSTDGTLSEIHRACDDYDGPNTVRILECPVEAPVGMSGLNAHLNWLNQQTDADIIIQTSADDLDTPDRAAVVIEAYEKNDPACVHTTQSFLSADFELLGYTRYPFKDGFVTGAEDIENMVGSSSSMSWSREFYERIGGIHGITCPDIYLPYIATQDKGLYFVFADVHAYVQNNNVDNTGLEGVLRCAETKDRELQIAELCHFQITNTLREIALKCQETYPDWNQKDREVLLKTMVERALAWSEVRHQLTMKGIPPLSMRP